MKRMLILVLAAIILPFTALAENDPKANEKAQVVAGNARFTVLTPQMIRMEWSEDGKFEDRATLTFVNRKLDVPQFKVRQTRSKVTITTSNVTLTYIKGAKFSAENLKAEILVAGKKVVWHYGDKDTQNLMGTTRTLDGYYGFDTPKNRKSRSLMEHGLLSRAGWTVVDDSKRHLFVPVDSHWKQWVECRPEGDRLDLYLFAYGHEYTKALKDYTRVAGNIPLPPKYVFGYWWSRYWQYSDNELRDLVETMRSLDIPLDVLIVDMDWHETWGLSRKNPKRDEYGQRVGWTGYTWKKQLFPSPENFLEWCHKQNLKTSLNLHPASGIQPYEEPYKRFVEAYDWKEVGKSVPFKMSEQKWADAYFETVLGPMEKQGVDFWWLDWQQWVHSKYVKDLNNTFWLNHTFDHHMAEKGNERPMIYHRWGGLGSHRYQTGFSGDTYIAWEVLQFLPWFTATASNVGYGYWGHDIGGHMFHKEDKKEIDPELYLRWLQYGVFTPVFKTHCTKDRIIERRIWQFPNHMFDMRAAMHLRYALVPYIYAAARETFDTGVSMTRPMYYSHPEYDLAYTSKDQFMFGGDLLVAPIVTPTDKVTGLATRKVWLPKGEKWFNMVSGKLYEGSDSEVEIHCALSENPYFAKAGSIIPMYPKSVRNLQQTLNSYLLTFVPGGDGETTIYEDDGKSKDYSTAYATIKVSKRTEGNKVIITIAPRKGGFEGAVAKNIYELRLPANYPPKSVRVDGREFKYSRFAEIGEWGYDGYTLAPYILVGEVDNAKGCTVEIEFAEGDLAAQDRLYGIQGIVNRCVALTAEFKEAYAIHYDPYPLLPDFYMNVSQAPNFIMEAPQNIHENIENYHKSLAECLSEVDKMDKFSNEFRERVKAQLTKQ
ncbi:MAG: DUF5110 domain-containing protein [Alistipes sp.]|nr:DUF5110 domain-containing protein [Alistipes sp.]